MGDFVIPILTSISHPQHSWKSGMASTRRWHGLPTKSPLSYIAFDMTKNIDDVVSEYYFPTSYINYSIPWRSGTIWSRGPCHLLLLKHCIRSKLNIGDQTSKSYFPNINTLHITIQENLIYCKGVYWKVAICCPPLNYPLAFVLLSIAYYTILGLDKY